MTAKVLIDTGPLIAILSSRDQYHLAATDALRQVSPPMQTCWPVLTEAIWLLRHYPGAVQRLLSGFDSGLFQLLTLDEAAVPWVAKFLARYKKIGAQAADAALMYLAEREDIDTIFTFDRKDFSVYRMRGNRALRVLPE